MSIENRLRRLERRIDEWIGDRCERCGASREGKTLRIRIGPEPPEHCPCGREAWLWITPPDHPDPPTQH